VAARNSSSNFATSPPRMPSHQAECHKVTIGEENYAEKSVLPGSLCFAICP